MLKNSSKTNVDLNFNESLKENKCPYHVNNICNNRTGRAIGCRIYFCEDSDIEMQDASNLAINELKTHCLSLNIPWFYGVHSDMLKAAELILKKSSREIYDYEVLENEIAIFLK